MVVAKNCHNSFYLEMEILREGEPHADRTFDLRWFHRPRRADGAGAGEEHPHPEDRRTTGLTVMPGLPAGGRRIVGIAAMSGTGCRRTGAAQVRRAKDRRRHALRILRATRRFAQLCPT